MLKHVPGSKMRKANSLSRRLDQEVEVEKDNEDEMLVKPEFVREPNSVPELSQLLFVQRLTKRTR